jgi:hypothetical protein
MWQLKKRAYKDMLATLEMAQSPMLFIYVMCMNADIISVYVVVLTKQTD